MADWACLEQTVRQQHVSTTTMQQADISYTLTFEPRWQGHPDAVVRPGALQARLPAAGPTDHLNGRTPGAAKMGQHEAPPGEHRGPAPAPGPHLSPATAERDRQRAADGRPAGYRRSRNRTAARQMAARLAAERDDNRAVEELKQVAARGPATGHPTSGEADSGQPRHDGRPARQQPLALGAFDAGPVPRGIHRTSNHHHRWPGAHSRSRNGLRDSSRLPGLLRSCGGGAAGSDFVPPLGGWPAHARNTRPAAAPARPLAPW